MNQKVAGIIVLLLVMGAGTWYYVNQGGDGSKKKLSLFNKQASIQVKGFVGGEKVGFLSDEEVKKYLARNHGIAVNYSKAGSIEMVRKDMGPVDFLWPSNQVAVELYKNRTGQNVKSEIIFNSPIVMYSWDKVGDALAAQNLLSQEDGAYFLSSFTKFIGLIEKKTKWKDIGLAELFGKVSVISTDPSKSNSGNMFAGLLANIMHGDVVDEQSIGSLLPKIKAFFARLGYLEHSSGDLFEQYLRTGMGAKPMIVGYENQIVEFSLAHQDLWPKIKDKVRILYPVPTVWSSHALIALTSNGKKLIEALKDPKIQQLAWEKHGFRSGLMGVENDPSILKIVGIPANIKQVVPMPTANVMDQIIKTVANQ